MKVINNFLITDKNVNDYLRETKFLMDAKNQFIIKYFDHFIENDLPYIVTQFYQVNAEKLIQ